MGVLYSLRIEEMFLTYCSPLFVAAAAAAAATADDDLAWDTVVSRCDDMVWYICTILSLATNSVFSA